MKSNPKAFTLIELLVVIAIIAILAAILFPVFAQAKLAAKKASDLTQVKQIGTALQIYLGDADDRFPLRSTANFGTGPGGIVRWSANSVVQPYVKNGAIFKSPGDSATLGAITPDVWAYPSMKDRSKVYVNSYVANAIPFSPDYDAYAIDPSEKLPGAQSGVFGPSEDYVVAAGYGGYPDVGNATSATAVQFPSELIVLFDGATDMATYYDKEVASSCANWTNTEVEHCVVDFVAPWYPLYFATGFFGNTPPDRVLREYNGSANYVMADSSARSLKPGALVKGGAYLNQHRWFVSPGQ